MDKKAKIDIEQFCYDSDLQQSFLLIMMMKTVYITSLSSWQYATWWWSQNAQSRRKNRSIQYNYTTLTWRAAVLSEVEQLLGHTYINDIESPDEQALVEVSNL